MRYCTTTGTLLETWIGFAEVLSNYRNFTRNMRYSTSTSTQTTSATVETMASVASHLSFWMGASTVRKSVVMSLVLYWSFMFSAAKDGKK